MCATQRYAESTLVVQAELIFSQQHRSVPSRNPPYPLSPTLSHSNQTISGHLDSVKLNPLVIMLYFSWSHSENMVKAKGGRSSNRMRRRGSKQGKWRRYDGYPSDIAYIETLTAGQSRSISRVLFCLPRQMAMIIPLGHTLPYASSDLTRRHRASNPYPTSPHAWRPHERNRSIASLFGLAPGGVYRAPDVATGTGALLPHRFTLTRIHGVAARRSTPAPGGLFSVALSLGSPHWTLSSTLLYGARTFLPLPERQGAII